MHELAHFSIPCADVERAKRFYEAVFGWHIEPWGPPNYYLIFPSYPDRTVTGDLHEHPAADERQACGGYECTFRVADVQAIAKTVVANGGRIDLPEHRIEGVGNVMYFIDTEGNRLAAMKYDGC